MEFNATFLIAAISFIVFVIIMNFIFYKPIEKIVNKRENFIDENLDEARKNNVISQKLIDEYDRKINDANLQGKSVIDKETMLAKEKKAELIQEAQQKVAHDNIINQEELKKTYSETKISLQNEAQHIADEIAAKLFGKEFETGGEG